MQEITRYAQQNLQAEAAGIPVDWRKAFEALYTATDQLFKKMEAEKAEMEAEAAAKGMAEGLLAAEREMVRLKACDDQGQDDGAQV